MMAIQEDGFRTEVPVILHSTPSRHGYLLAKAHFLCSYTKRLYGPASKGQGRTWWQTTNCTWCGIRSQVQPPPPASHSEVRTGQFAAITFLSTRSLQQLRSSTRFDLALWSECLRTWESGSWIPMHPTIFIKHSKKKKSNLEVTAQNMPPACSSCGGFQMCT